MFILIPLLLGVVNTASNTCELNDLSNYKFDLKRYTGKWYEIARSKDFPMEKGECAIALYDINGKGNVDLINSEVFNGRLNSVRGVGYRTDSPNMLFLNFGYNGDSRYIIVDTDYDNYSVVYSCGEYMTHKLEYVWILSRRRSLDDNTLSKLLLLIKNKFKISDNDLHFTNQNESLCKLN
jgi:apolipoprotein D and lipocalin family protein